MKRFMYFLTLVALAALPFTGVAQAKKAPAQVTALTIPALGVDVVSPDGNVDSPFIHLRADVANADTATACITRHLAALPADLPVPCNLVSYVTFSIDNEVVAHDGEAPYSIGARYDGPSGRHTVTAQAWRNVQSDFGVPVLLGQDSQRFCLINCGS
jgi:hypothetical protein